LNIFTLKIRLLLIELPNGEKEIIITTLVDQKKFPNERFADLYLTVANRKILYTIQT
jgi:hypothetical protein